MSSQVHNEEELKIIDDIKNKRQKVIDALDKDPDTITSPRMLEVYSGLLKDQEAQVNTTAKLRLQKKEVDNQGQTKVLITELLQSIGTKTASITTASIEENRKHKSIDVNLVDGETSQGVEQFDVQRLEDSVRESKIKTTDDKE